MVTIENARDDPMRGLKMIKEVGCYGYNKIVFMHEMTSKVITVKCVAMETSRPTTCGLLYLNIRCIPLALLRS